MEEETSDNNDVAIVIGANDTESTEEERSGSVIAIGDINNSGSSKLQSKQAKDRHNTFTDSSSTGELDIRDQYPRSRLARCSYEPEWFSSTGRGKSLRGKVEPPPSLYKKR